MPKHKTIVVDFDITDIVFLKVRDEPVPGMITALSISGNGGICYYVTWPNGQEHRHFACELTQSPRGILTSGDSPIPESL